MRQIGRRLAEAQGRRLAEAQGRRLAAPGPREPWWKGWYKTARWQRLRWAVLQRDLFTCWMCGRVEHDSSRLVADHRQPHRGDEDLFWAEENLQTLCKPCHDGPKQRIERSGTGRGG